jgi:hypothetical protein
MSYKSIFNVFFFHFKSDCAVKQPHKRARNPVDDKRLWELSEELVGLKN